MRLLLDPVDAFHSLHVQNEQLIQGVNCYEFILQYMTVPYILNILYIWNSKEF